MLESTCDMDFTKNYAIFNVVRTTRSFCDLHDYINNHYTNIITYTFKSSDRKIKRLSCLNMTAFP